MYYTTSNRYEGSSPRATTLSDSDSMTPNPVSAMAITRPHTPLLRLMKHGFVLLFITAFPLIASAGWLPDDSGSGDDFLPVDQALPFSYRTADDGVTLSWNTAHGYYLYKGRITVEAAEPGVVVGTPDFSLPGVVTQDDYFGEVTVFNDPVDARVSVQLPDGMTEANLKVTYQGCAKAGLCYPPQTRKVLFYPGTRADTPASTMSPPSSGGNGTLRNVSSPDSESATGLARFLGTQSLWLVSLIFLTLGLGLTFTPCVLPMVPIISSLVSSHNTQSTAHALLLSISYVLGMALTYAAAGVITGLLGASFNLQAQLQSPWVLGLFAALFVLFALAMFNVYDLQLPRFIRDRLDNASHKMSGGRVLSVFAIGAISALVVSPCVSAPLAGSLLYISTTQDAVTGGVALLALGIGMGIPLILVAVGGRRLLPGSGPWMNVIKSFYGVMLLAVAIWLVERLLPGALTLALWGLLAAITGVQLGAFDPAKPGWQRTWKGLGTALFAYGIALLAGALSGANDPLRPLAPFTTSTVAAERPGPVASTAGFLRLDNPDAIRQRLRQAADQHEPVMLDFYADWCISCKVMERDVFSDPAVMQSLKPVTLLQLDLTDNSEPQQAMLNTLGLFGPPAILFYDRDGNELTGARVLGEMDQAEFLQHLGRVRQALAL